MSSEKYTCPLLEGTDAYFSSLIELDLGIDRVGCAGPVKSGIGTLVCRAYRHRLEEYDVLMRPSGNAAGERTNDEDVWYEPRS